jgi:hypothetical protein
VAAPAGNEWVTANCERAEQSVVTGCKSSGEDVFAEHRTYLASPAPPSRSGGSSPASLSGHAIAVIGAFVIVLPDRHAAGWLSQGRQRIRRGRASQGNQRREVPR